MSTEHPKREDLWHLAGFFIKKHLQPLLTGLGAPFSADGLEEAKSREEHFCYEIGRAIGLDPKEVAKRFADVSLLESLQTRPDPDPATVPGNAECPRMVHRRIYLNGLDLEGSIEDIFMNLLSMKRQYVEVYGLQANDFRVELDAGHNNVNTVLLFYSPETPVEVKERLEQEVRNAAKAARERDKRRAQYEALKAEFEPGSKPKRRPFQKKSDGEAHVA